MNSDHVSHSQKYLSLIQKAANQKRKAKRQKRGDEVAEARPDTFEAGMDFATGETFGYFFEFHKTDDQIDRDRVHPDPDKRPAPAAMILDIDDVIE